jgi:hypothetical protein
MAAKTPYKKPLPNWITSATTSPTTSVTMGPNMSPDMSPDMSPTPSASKISTEMRKISKHTKIQYILFILSFQSLYSRMLSAILCLGLQF